MSGFTLRIKDNLMRKFRYLCSYEHRSANQQLLKMIEETVREFEEANGEITDDLLPRQPGQMKTCIHAAELPGPPQMGGLFAACRAGFSTSPQRNREMYQKFFFCLLSNYGIMKGIKRSHVYWR